jgi:RNA polymerase sigma factor (TIGR02999 family)
VTDPASPSPQRASAAPAGEAMAKLVLMVYDELRKLAAARLGREKQGQTLQATALVHEAWLKLAGSESVRDFRGRTHFLGVAAEAMRCILIDNARRKAALRHGGHLQRAEIAPADLPLAAGISGEEAELLAINEAVEELGALDPRKAELVKLRYFIGLTIEDAAEALGISPATAKRDWTFARAWLARKLKGR